MIGLVLMKRINYYDAIKTLAIFMVCFYHGATIEKDITVAGNITTYFHYFLFSTISVCVPLFFMVNGAIILNKEIDIKDTFLKAIKIYFLYFFWGAALLLLLKLILNDKYTTLDFIKSVFFLKEHRTTQLWFLRALVSIYLILPLIKLAYNDTDRRYLFYTMVVIFVFSFGNNLINIVINSSYYFSEKKAFFDKNFNFFPLFNPFGGYFYGLFYFIIGAILARRISKKTTILKKYYSLPLFLFSTLVLFLYGIVMSKTNMKYFSPVWGCYDTPMTLIMSISAFIFLSSFRYENKVIKKTILLIGRNSFGIYILHIFFIRLLRPILNKSSFSNNLILNVIFVLVVMLLTLITTLILKQSRYLSTLVNIKKVSKNYPQQSATRLLKRRLQCLK